ncbi:MAG: protein translocase subunit SecD [Gammaproteobacteria bacterium]|nr:protein translocase subunit SecD [Gammaproteobacteria bacterium]
MYRKKYWRRAGVLAVVLAGVVLALPNLFPMDPSLQIGREDGAPWSPAAVERITAALGDVEAAPSSVELRDGAVHALFDDSNDRVRAAEALTGELRDAVVALDLEPRLPGWMRAIGLRPVGLGLDLRGGVHFQYVADLDAVRDRVVEAASAELRAALRDARVPAAVSARQDTVVVEVGNTADADAVRAAVAGLPETFGFNPAVDVRGAAGGGQRVEVRIPGEIIAERQNLAMERNLSTLRKRVDALGVSEPIVQRQGRTRILVQVPGMQDPAQLDRILGSTATLEWRLEDTLNDPSEALRTGRAPAGSILRFEADGTPRLLKRQVIAAGEHLTDATFGYSEGQPAVFIRLGGDGARRMLDATRLNLGKPLAVLMIEETREAAGDGYRTRRDETVVFVGRIDGVFSSSFRLSGGFTPRQAQNLALVLRSGALAAPIYKDRWGTVGATLGEDNIRTGAWALMTGLAAVAAFMAHRYRVFGMIANLALIANLIITIGLLSLLPVALTLPGIAGVVLTVGMAVDANVLIIERIREELGRGNSPRASIAQGYDRAWTSIADANVTTLIAALVLLVFGTGPIRGFAVTLGLGVLTSMFTAVTGTRTLVDLLYGGRNVQRLPVGRGF